MKKYMYSLVMLIVLSLCSVNSFAQENSESEANKTYRIYTHTFVGSNDAGNQKKLSGKMKKAFTDVKDYYSYTNYKLLGTQFQFIKQKGSISYKSILKTSDYIDRIKSPIFASWDYKSLETEILNGKKYLGFKSFRFDMRYPVKNNITNANKETISTINYESVKLSAQAINFSIGEPVVFASLPLELSDKTLFFVAQVEEVN